ncbi:hypothetical protein Q7P37_011417 [Cladosporium fusiforme]
MPHGKEARKRNWKQASKTKVAAKRAERRAAKVAMVEPQPRPLTIPTVTEDDLLSFQFTHFGDDTKPDTFFVDPEHALNYHPGLDELGDDGLGWYEDGVKRTLTDEQIEMFRHTELEELMRKRRLEAEAEEQEVDDYADDDDDEYEPTLPDALSSAPPQSPLSEASSLEQELSTKATTANTKQRQSSDKLRQSNRSQTPNGRHHQRKKEIPYEQRHKRKWENYIDGNDPVHGSMTRRRLVRELDEQRAESVSIDYGDEDTVVAPPPPPRHLATIPGRRVISYEDD